MSRDPPGGCGSDPLHEMHLLLLLGDEEILHQSGQSTVKALFIAVAAQCQSTEEGVTADGRQWSVMEMPRGKGAKQ